MIDVGTRIDMLNIQDAKSLLENLGYSPGLVKLMLRHYLLTPGYQLCYTIGAFELERLKKKFSRKFGIKKFHDIILNTGQVPFDLLEKKLERTK